MEMKVSRHDAVAVRVALVAFVFALAPQAGFGAQQTVSAQDDFFSPQTITVSQGDTVFWTNHGMDLHTVTADDGGFDSGTLQPGGTFAQTFNTPGTFPYYCRFHGASGGVGMSGVVTVTTAQSVQPPLNNRNPIVFNPIPNLNDSSLQIQQQQQQQQVNIYPPQQDFYQNYQQYWCGSYYSPVPCSAQQYGSAYYDGNTNYDYGYGGVSGNYIINNTSGYNTFATNNYNTAGYGSSAFSSPYYPRYPYRSYRYPRHCQYYPYAYGSLYDYYHPSSPYYYPYLSYCGNYNPSWWFWNNW